MGLVSYESAANGWRSSQLSKALTAKPGKPAMDRMQAYDPKYSVSMLDLSIKSMYSTKYRTGLVYFARYSVL